VILKIEFQISVLIKIWAQEVINIKPFIFQSIVKNIK